jgi:hypothetical protein
MSGLIKSTNQNQLFDKKLNLQSLPVVWLRNRQKLGKVETALQIFTEGEVLPPSNRLVVILPDADFDIYALAKQIWSIATSDCRQVLLLTKPVQDENEYHSRLTLSTMASLIRDPRIVVKTQLVLGMSLYQALLQCSQPDDVFVCFEEHRISGFLKKNRLAKILAQNTNLPVYTLRGPISEMTDPLSAHLIDFVLLAICVASLVGFFALQVWFDHNTAGTLHTILQIVTVSAEIWIVAACANRSFRI